MADGPPPSPPTTPFLFRVVLPTFNLINHLIVGAVVFLVGAFALNSLASAEPSTTQKHVVICVIGYQLLMAEGIMSLNSDNILARALSFREKRTAHWILQFSGGALAIAGTSLQISSREAHFVSNHGIMGLVALIFTIISMVGGLVTLYSTEFRGVISPKFTKLFHIFIGTCAFVFGIVTLMLGMDKNFFRAWASDGVTECLLVITSLGLFITLLVPMKISSRLRNEKLARFLLVAVDCGIVSGFMNAPIESFYRWTYFNRWLTVESCDCVLGTLNIIINKDEGKK